MKRLFLDFQMGVAGDMLTATVLGLTDNPFRWVERLNAVGIPKVTYRLEPKEEGGLQGYHCTVAVNGHIEGEDIISDHRDHHNYNQHNHDQQAYGHERHDSQQHHKQDHYHLYPHHSHSHHTLLDVQQIINGLSLPDEVKRDALAVYRLIADAEAEVHGTDVNMIHFHEVGAYDAIADVVAVCYVLHHLAFDRIMVSPIHMGYGTVHCAHGTLNVPAPATMKLLQGLPCYTDYQVKGELCTPTGVALLRYFGTDFGPMPVMSIESVSYGFGTKLYNRPNCVRAFVDTITLKEDKAEHSVENSEQENARDVTDTVYNADEIIEIQCNIDDMTAEEIGYAVEKLITSSALDVFTTSVMMKKQRPGTMITVLCHEEHRAEIEQLLLKHTTTLGLRFQKKERHILHRESGSIAHKGQVIRYKKAYGADGTSIKYEYDDLVTAAEALGISLLELKRQL